MASLTQTRVTRKRWKLGDLWRFTVPKDDLPSISALHATVKADAATASPGPRLHIIEDGTRPGTEAIAPARPPTEPAVRSRSISTVLHSRTLRGRSSASKRRREQQQQQSNEQSEQPDLRLQSTIRQSDQENIANANDNSIEASVPGERAIAEINSAAVPSCAIQSVADACLEQSEAGAKPIVVLKSSLELEWLEKRICIGGLRELPPPEQLEDEWYSHIREDVIKDLQPITRSLRLPSKAATIEPELRMVGEWDGKSHTVQLCPTVWIRCGSEECRKAVSKAVLDMRGLQTFSKGRVTVHLRAPIQSARPKPDDVVRYETTWQARSTDGQVVLRIKQLTTTSTPSACGIQMEIIRDGHAERSWVIGGLVRIDQALYGLTTAHSFFDLPEASKSISVVDSFLESSTPSTSRHLEATAQHLDHRHDVRVGLYNYGGSLPYHVSASKFSSDYALIRMGRTQKGLSNCYRTLSTPSASPSLTTIEKVSRDTSCGDVTIVCSADDIRHGYLLKRPAAFITPRSVFRTRKIQTDKPLELGRSGTWVTRGTELLGMIVAVYEGEHYAHMLPMEEIFSDIQTLLTNGSHVPIVDLDIGKTMLLSGRSEDDIIEYESSEDESSEGESLASAPHIRTSLDIEVDPVRENPQDVEAKIPIKPEASNRLLRSFGIDEWQALLMVVVVFLTSFIVGMDVTLFPTIMPSVTNQFLSLNDIGWYGSTYFLGRGFMSPLLLWIFSRKRMVSLLLVWLLVFEIGNLVCAVAHKSFEMIIGRAITGMGAAGCMFSTELFFENLNERRSARIALVTLRQAYSLGMLAGPIIGGALAQRETWRWGFFLNISIAGLIALVAVTAWFRSGAFRPLFSSNFFRQRRWSHRTHETNGIHIRNFFLNGISFVFIMVSVLLLVIGIQIGIPRGPKTSAPIFVASGVCILSGFGSLIALHSGKFRLERIELEKKGMLPLRAFGPLAAFSCLWSFAFFAFNHYIPTWFQAATGARPLQSGIMYMPTAASFFITFSIVGAQLVAGRYGIKSHPKTTGYTLLTASLSFMALGAGLSSTFNAHTPSRLWIPYQIIFGIGAGLGVRQATFAAWSHLSGRRHKDDEQEPKFADFALATTLIQSAEAIGGAIAISAAQAVFRNQLNKETSSIQGFDIAHTGATSFRQRLHGDALQTAITALNKAITSSFFVSTAAGALPAAFFAIALALGPCIAPVIWLFFRRKKTYQITSTGSLFPFARSAADSRPKAGSQPAEQPWAPVPVQEMAMAYPYPLVPPLEHQSRQYSAHELGSPIDGLRSTPLEISTYQPYSIPHELGQPHGGTFDPLHPHAPSELP